jgi:hypothetical protein
LHLSGNNLNKRTAHVDVSSTDRIRINVTLCSYFRIAEIEAGESVQQTRVRPMG